MAKSGQSESHHLGFANSMGEGISLEKTTLLEQLAETLSFHKRQLEELAKQQLCVQEGLRQCQLVNDKLAKQTQLLLNASCSSKLTASNSSHTPRPSAAFSSTSSQGSSVFSTTCFDCPGKAKRCHPESGHGSASTASSGCHDPNATCDETCSPAESKTSSITTAWTEDEDEFFPGQMTTVFLPVPEDETLGEEAIRYFEACAAALNDTSAHTRTAGSSYHQDSSNLDCEIPDDSVPSHSSYHQDPTCSDSDHEIEGYTPTKL